MRTAAAAVVLLATLGCSESVPASCPAVPQGWASPASGQPVHVVANVITLQGGKSTGTASLPTNKLF